MPCDTRYSSRAKERVVLPAPDRPVNQIVQPRNPPVEPCTLPRRSRVTVCSWKETLVAFWTCQVLRVVTGCCSSSALLAGGRCGSRLVVPEHWIVNPLKRTNSYVLHIIADPDPGWVKNQDPDPG